MINNYLKRIYLFLNELKNVESNCFIFLIKCFNCNLNFLLKKVICNLMCG